MAMLLAITAPVWAQTPTPEQLQMLQGLTPEQLQMLQGLPPDQQAALLERIDSGAATGEVRGASAAAAGNPSGSRTDGTSNRAGRGDAPKVPAIPVLGAGDSVVLEVSRRAGTDPDRKEQERLDAIVSLVMSRNPYALDRSAHLNLPGFAPIALGGLTELQAMQRLMLEPTLSGLQAKLTRLPLESQALKPFGYEFFDNGAAAFVQPANLPVPADYVVGPGDQFNVQVFGSQNRNHNLTVNRDGLINFPELGPIRVGGVTFTEASRDIENRVRQQLVGVRASVSMGSTRSIGIFVTGEARHRGSFTVGGMATITTALFAAGGITDIGSLRDIQLKRQGQVVRRFDLYDLLLGGDTSNDAKLLPGDVIFIPTVGPTVSVDGEVKRPAIYELRGQVGIAEILQVAGGLTPEADMSRASLTRIEADGRRVVRDVDLNQLAGTRLGNGDVLKIAALRPQLDAGVRVDGFVYRPGLFAWREGMRLSDVIGSVEELKPGADQHYILVRREGGAERRISYISADLTVALAARGSVADPQLAARDQIQVFELGPGRERIIRPWLAEQRLQSDLDRPTEIVSVRGRVKVPGDYPLEQGMRVRDLLRAGGNLEAAAYGGNAELTRYVINASGTRETQLVTIDLAAARRGDPGANLELRPFDYLLVQETPEWSEEETVLLRGQVRFPGTYSIRRGESLHQVLQRAGGLTSEAFPEGSAFTRSDLKVLEQQQLDRLADTMRGDLVALSMQAARAGQGSAGDTLLAGQSLLTQLQSVKATGRFVIDLPGLLAGTAHDEKDVLLRDGDELFIPKRRQEITVIGEVQNASSHLYQRQLSRSNYIQMSGGPTRRADKGHIYVVRADGSVASDKAIKSGDTIVVPVDAERMPRLPFWQAVTQILYNVAVSVAAVNSF
jgi:protein involved in polysaccharide export with SLBB domain